MKVRAKNASARKPDEIRDAAKSTTEAENRTQPASPRAMVARKKKELPVAALPKTVDAMAFLRAGNQRVAALFSTYACAKTANEKKRLVTMICMELSFHAQLEADVFYPAIQQVIQDGKLIAKARVEQANINELMAQVNGVTPTGELFEAKISVLAEYALHHAKEEQGALFKQVKASRLDLMALGAKLAQHKKKLLAEQTAASGVAAPIARKPNGAGLAIRADGTSGPLSGRAN